MPHIPAAHEQSDPCTPRASSSSPSAVLCPSQRLHKSCLRYSQGPPKKITRAVPWGGSLLQNKPSQQPLLAAQGQHSEIRSQSSASARVERDSTGHKNNYKGTLLLHVFPPSLHFLLEWCSSECSAHTSALRHRGTPPTVGD